MRMLSIIISCGDEAITKSFKEDYLIFSFYSLDGEYTVEIVIHSFLEQLLINYDKKGCRVTCLQLFVH
jgi:hypothetical protein